jgi:hypothetical protein
MDKLNKDLKSKIINLNISKVICQFLWVYEGFQHPAPIQFS